MKLVLIGAICGLAWATGLRGYMAEIAGPESTVTWLGTMAGVLAPGAAAGGLLGWAEHLRQAGDRRPRRWLALSPFLLSAATLAMPEALMALLTSGLGGGAIMVPLLGLAGGYALCSSGRPWIRAACGIAALSIIPAWAAVAPLLDSSLAVGTAHGAFVALHFYSLLAVLSFACAIPFRGDVPKRFPAEPESNRAVPRF